MSRLIACLLLAACSGPKVWVKDGGTQADFQLDAGQCKAQAFSIPNAPALQIAMAYNACMQGKGWSQHER